MQSGLHAASSVPQQLVTPSHLRQPPPLQPQHQQHPPQEIEAEAVLTSTKQQSPTIEPKEWCIDGAVARHRRTSIVAKLEAALPSEPQTHAVAAVAVINKGAAAEREAQQRVLEAEAVADCTWSLLASLPAAPLAQAAVATSPAWRRHPRVAASSLASSTATTLHVSLTPGQALKQLLPMAASARGGLAASCGSHRRVKSEGAAFAQESPERTMNGHGTYSRGMPYYTPPAARAIDDALAHEARRMRRVQHAMQTTAIRIGGSASPAPRFLRWPIRMGKAISNNPNY